MTGARIAGFFGARTTLHGGAGLFREPVPPAPTVGRFITTASVQLAVTLNVPQVPTEGSQIRATSAVSSPGGGYVVAAGVRAQEVDTYLASPLGTGPNSHSIRRSLTSVGITTAETALVGDVGVAVTMVEGDGKTASVVTPGVESEPSKEILKRVEARPGDLVHINGGDLVTEVGAHILTEWATSLPRDVTVVVSVSPAVDIVPAQLWIPLLRRADIITMNIREGALMTKILGDVFGMEGIHTGLGTDKGWVRRTGPLGCEVILEGGKDRVAIPAFPANPVDTSGVGDTHVAVMCASLLQGESLIEACRRANAASAIEISHPTSFPLPTKQQVDAVLAGANPYTVGCAAVEASDEESAARPSRFS